MTWVIHNLQMGLVGWILATALVVCPRYLYGMSFHDVGMRGL